MYVHVNFSTDWKMELGGGFHWAPIFLKFLHYSLSYHILITQLITAPWPGYPATPELLSRYSSPSSSLWTVGFTTSDKIDVKYKKLNNICTHMMASVRRWDAEIVVAPHNVPVEMDMNNICVYKSNVRTADFEWSRTLTNFSGEIHAIKV